MPKQNLASLKSRLKAAQHELDTLLKVIEQKQPILDDLLLRIREADKTLEDDFSHRKLEMQRDINQYKETLAQGTEQALLQKIIADSEAATVREQLTDLTAKLHTLEKAITGQELLFERNHREIDVLKQDIFRQQQLKTEMGNVLNDLQQQKKDLEDNLTMQAQESNKAILAMQAQYDNDCKQIESDKLAKTTELELVEQQLITQRQQFEENRTAQEQKEVELIHRENALVTKIKVFIKEREELDIEKRRWNYINPSKLDV